jgi:hypothetical protein
MPKALPIITLQCGATATQSPAFHLIPMQALIHLAKRFSLGAIRHEPFGWMRGLVGKPPLPPKPTPEVEYMLERSNHVIHHALKFQAKLQGLIPDDGDDDAGAIAWGGVVLSELRDAQRATIQE